MQQAQANYDATVATYRETTLEAFQQVEDNWAALRILAQEVTQESPAVEESQYNLKLFTNLYEGGADPYLQVVTAQTTLLFNQRNETDILRRQMDASVLLIKAMGGGWDASQLPPVSSFALISLNSSCCFVAAGEAHSLLGSRSPLGADNDASKSAKSHSDMRICLAFDLYSTPG